jgi:hypothetical protein
LASAEFKGFELRRDIRSAEASQEIRAKRRSKGWRRLRQKKIILQMPVG